MKFKILLNRVLGVMVLSAVMAGCSKIPQHGNGTSFRAQLCELVQMKDAGLISEEEYRDSRHSLLSRMLH